MNLSHYFEYLGSDNGGMHMIIKGKDLNEKEKQIKWFIIAKNGDGPQIPAIPAIILTKKIMNQKLTKSGAFSCFVMVSLEEYLDELKEFSVMIRIEN